MVGTISMFLPKAAKLTKLILLSAVLHLPPVLTSRLYPLLSHLRNYVVVHPWILDNSYVNLKTISAKVLCPLPTFGCICGCRGLAINGSDANLNFLGPARYQ
jgi:hypothetical protein